MDRNRAWHSELLRVHEKKGCEKGCPVFSLLDFALIPLNKKVKGVLPPERAINNVQLHPRAEKPDLVLPLGQIDINLRSATVCRFPRSTQLDYASRPMRVSFPDELIFTECWPHQKHPAAQIKRPLRNMYPWASNRSSILGSSQVRRLGFHEPATEYVNSYSSHPTGDKPRQYEVLSPHRPRFPLYLPYLRRRRSGNDQGKGPYGSQRVPKGPVPKGRDTNYVSVVDETPTTRVSANQGLGNVVSYGER